MSSAARNHAAILSILFFGIPSLAHADESDSPVLAPDLPGVSVRLKAGERAPFGGRLVALDENVRRTKALVECQGELADGKANVWTSPGVIVALVLGAVVVGAAAGAGVTALALKR